MRGDGSLYLRGSTWWACYSIAGRQIQQSLETTDKKRAGAILREITAQARGEPRRPGDIGGHEGRVLRWPSFGGMNLEQATGPIVYAWVRRDVVLYIGKSENGLARPFNPSHHRLGKRLRITDRILVFRCRSAKTATMIERALIRALRPPVNA